MRSGLILKKMGMTRIFDDFGNSFPVTVLKLEENQVVKVLDRNKNGYFAIQVGTGKVKIKNMLWFSPVPYSRYITFQPDICPIAAMAFRHPR